MNAAPAPPQTQQKGNPGHIAPVPEERILRSTAGFSYEPPDPEHDTSSAEIEDWLEQQQINQSGPFQQTHGPPHSPLSAGSHPAPQNDGSVVAHAPLATGPSLPAPPTCKGEVMYLGLQQLYSAFPDVTSTHGGMTSQPSAGTPVPASQSDVEEYYQENDKLLKALKRENERLRLANFVGRI
ncbi:MAG: hypothetical protein Q9164_000856 [Protoblastenia rupestris]